jgi:excisionase family DNA binding protein
MEKVHDRVRSVWSDLEHLRGMDTERLFGLGLEPVLTTSELAEYLGVHVQAIHDLRTDGRGPSGIRVGREIRYRVSDVRRWLDGLHEPQRSLSGRRDER